MAIQASRSRTIDELPDYITADDLAELLHTTRRSVERWVSRHELPAPVRLGRTIRWSKKRILEFLDKRAAFR